MSAALGASYATVRGLLFVTLLLMIGSQAAGLLLAGPEDELRSIGRRVQCATPVWIAALLLLVLARGTLQVLSFVDPGDHVTPDLIQGLLLSGSWGHAWTAQVCVLLTLLAWSMWRRNRAPGLDVALVIGTLAVVWCQSGTGHANGAVWHGPWGRALDGLHIVGAGIWLGTLAVLLMYALPALRQSADLIKLARLVRRYSNVARTGVTLIVISGITAALVYAGSPGQFVASSWGRLLIAKLAAMAGVMSLGWYNWRVVTPQLERRDADARALLHRTVRLELLLGIAMLAITAVLVATPLPGES